MKKTTKNKKSKSAKGFAAMSHEEVEEIAHEGGEAREQQLGHEDYVELGHMGGIAPHESRGRKAAASMEG